MSPAAETTGRPLPTAARVLLHAGQPTPGHRSADLKSLWQRWTSRAAPQAAPADEAHVRVEVATEPGVPLLALRDLHGSVELTVDPGTYDITVTAGRRTRRYTVALHAGATFDLDLHRALQAA